MSIAVIAGLGNPGSEYQHTRHNLGFWLVDAFARQIGASWKHESHFQADVAKTEFAGRVLWLLKPQTFMNDSGLAVGPFLRYHKIESHSLAVLHDDITLPLGRLKVTIHGSAGGHNGITSILAHAGTDFVHLKLGVGGKIPGEMDLKDHVLGHFIPDEEALLAARLPDFLAGLKLLLNVGPQLAMNQLNQRTPIPFPSPLSPKNS